MAEPALQHHVIIVGHGRSGTNMVLDLLDCHPDTFCRNEANKLIGTAFTGLGNSLFADPAPAADDTDGQQAWQHAWHRAVTQTIRTSGDRDRFALHKSYFRSALHARIGQTLMSRRRLRSLFLPRIDGRVTEQWPCPGLYYDRAAQARALPVLKILLSPAWVLRAHDIVPTQHIVHVVRAPHGFIQSWWSRYVTGGGGAPEQVFADNLPSLERILAHFGRTDEMPRNYSLANLVASELWRWRYVNEVMLAELSGSPRYLKLAYEEVMGDKLHWAGELYRFAGLDMTPACRQAVTSMQNTLFRDKKPNGLDPALVDAAVEQVIDGSAWRADLLGPQA